MTAIKPSPPSNRSNPAGWSVVRSSFLASAWYDRTLEGEMVMRSKQGSTHLTSPDVPGNVGIEVVTADTTIEPGEFVSKHGSP